MDIYTSRINLKRLNSRILDPVLMAGLTISIDRQPAQTTRLEVAISGATYALAGGTVSLNGENFSFTDDGSVVGVVDHTTIVGSIIIAGIDSGMITVSAVSKTGQPNYQEVVVEDNMPVRFYAQSGRIRMAAQGRESIAEYKIMADPEKDIQQNDLLYPVSGVFGLVKGKINFVRQIVDFDGATVSVEGEVMKLS